MKYFVGFGGGFGGRPFDVGAACLPAADVAVDEDDVVV
jgi:hypothetical protein